MNRRTQLRGDANATPAKAAQLLRFAREEVDSIKTDTTPGDRAKLRQAANKGWLALAAGADSYLLRTTGKTAKSKGDVLRVYKQLGAEAAGSANIVYDSLHINCGYEDRGTCTRDSARVGFRLAGQALNALARKAPRRR